jgi:hypothetical protein
MLITKPTTQSEEKEVEVTEKEFEENRYRCYRRCRYYRYGHRVYRKCYRKCYYYLESEKQEQSDVEFFSRQVESASESKPEETDITEKEFEESKNYRCYRYCKYYRYHHRVYRRCYRKCYYLTPETEKMTDAEMMTTLKPATQSEEKEVEVTEKEFEENRYRCYRRCRYYRYGHRVYRRCYRKCYYLTKENEKMTDA